MSEIKAIKVIIKFKNGKMLFTKCLSQKDQSIYDSSYWNLTKLFPKTTLSVEASIKAHLHKTLNIEHYETVFSKPAIFYGNKGLYVVVEVPNLTKITTPNITAIVAVSPKQLSTIKMNSLTVCTISALDDEEIKFILGIM